MQEITVKINNEEYKANLIEQCFNQDIQRQGKFTFLGKNSNGFIILQFIDIPQVSDWSKANVTLMLNNNTIIPNKVNIDDNNPVLITFYFKV